MLSNRVDLSRDSFLLVRKIIMKETLKMKHEIIFQKYPGESLSRKRKIAFIYKSFNSSLSFPFDGKNYVYKNDKMTKF